MEVSYQIVRVPAYAVNRTKRLVKAPKLFWSDTALALHLSGRAEPDGAYLENLVATDLFAWASLQSTPVSILYWRTASGAEVDLVVEAPSRVLPVEVTSSSRVTIKDARHLEVFPTSMATSRPRV
jgi:predicted AAA+ superfamily ATPase